MKPVLELLGKDFNARSEILASDSKPVGLVEYQLTEAQLETLVRRTREEFAGAAVLAVEALDDVGTDYRDAPTVAKRDVIDAIRALALTAQSNDGSAR